VPDNAYQKIADFYNTLHSDKDYAFESEQVKKYVDIYSNFSKIKTIFDFGCGTCSHLEYLIEDKVAVGLDISKEMIDVASKKSFKNVELFSCTIEEYKTDKKVDLVISLFNVFNHIHSIQELRKVFLKISDIMSEDGILIFDALNGSAVIKDPPNNRYYTKKTDSGEIEILSNVKTDFLTQRMTLENIVTAKTHEYKYSLEQTTWTPKVLIDLLTETGFILKAVYKSFTLDNALETDYKILFIALKA
jgi:SAM-dependent methyltransferase